MRVLRIAGGIIPAYAGSTWRRVAGLPGWWDHPRIRGEHRLVVHGEVQGAGSSPHTRGALHLQDRHHESQRIIPAYAGSTMHVYPPVSRFEDHPRIRGEHDIITATGCRPWGSSPHTRGALAGPRDDGFDPGIIPAYAGSTRRRARRRAAPTDHPRIRGEHSECLPFWRP